MNIDKNDFSISYLSDPRIKYLAGDSKTKINESDELDMKDLCLFRIDEVCFEDKAPRREALENVLSAMRIDGINFIFLITGDKNGVSFYYGVSHDNNCQNGTKLGINDIGDYILKPGIQGNFRGSKVVCIDPDEKRGIANKISNMKYSGMIEGVPGANKDDEKFQSVDRLVDVMQGDDFCFMVIAKPLDLETVLGIQADMYHLYSQLVPLSKASIQESESSNTGYSTSTSEGTSETVGNNTSTAISEGKNHTSGTNSGSSKSTSEGTSTSNGGSSSSNGTSKSYTQGTSKGESESDGTSSSVTKTTGTNTSKSTSKSGQESKSSGDSRSSSKTIEFASKDVQDWIKYLDDVFFPRLDYGKGKGVFVTTIAMFTNNKASLQKLQNTAISLYAGEVGNRVPLKAVPLTANAEYSVKNFQLPYGKINSINSRNAHLAHTAMSQIIDKNNMGYIGNWITTNELGVVAGLPQKEVVGLKLKEEVEFGLNYRNDIPEDDKIELGYLVQSGNILENNIVCMDKKVLDQHVFIAGVTGSGKTTTCQKLIHASDLPFIVIEPAKTEYRILKEDFDDLMVFTLGKNSVAPFVMNPFVFYRHESITSRVDMIKACIESAFDMEAAIPQIIESAIYKSYEDYGWNIATNKNSCFDDPFEKGSSAFPTLSDLLRNTSEVVKQQGFDDRLKNDYIGSIRARLQGLLVGSKGQMLNTHHSVDFEELLDHRVVLELEEIRSGSEKSLIMGFILINLSEAIKAKYLKQGKFRHLTLVEEAHRLLSKYHPGDDPNKRHGVEMFTDMLAEIRKYGESLIIVDQIPNKLTPEVLKNTNTKIIHRLFAEDDKDSIGNTVMLQKEQKEFLSNLDAGRAIFFSTGTDKAVQVQIKQRSDTSRKAPEDKELISIAHSFYRKHYKSGIICGTELMDTEPTEEQLVTFIKMNSSEVFDRFRKEITTKNGVCSATRDILSGYTISIGTNIFCKYIQKYVYTDLVLSKESPDKVMDMLQIVISGESINGLKKLDISNMFNEKTGCGE